MLFERTISKIKILNRELPEPRLLLDFLGFEKHVKQIRDRRGTGIWNGWYDHATYYIADLPPEKLYGNDEDVIIPAYVKAPDYELELACYATERALIKTFDQAVEYFSKHCYITILNDWSARDIQLKDIPGLGPSHSKSVIGKSIGPRFLPASELKLDQYGVFDLEMKLSVNGEERLSSNYNSIYFQHPQSGAKSAWSFPRLMLFLGQNNIAIQPGYVLGSGTIGSGCIAEFTAKLDHATGREIEAARYPWLQDGDTVQLTAEKIGTLKNKVKISAT